MGFVFGDWWLSDETTLTVEDVVTSRRCGKARRAVRRKLMEKRTWSLRTTGMDSRVRDLDGARAYNVPDEGNPADITDWLLTGARYVCDPASGEIQVTAECVKTGGDWDESIRMDAYEGY